MSHGAERIVASPPHADRPRSIAPSKATKRGERQGHEGQNGKWRLDESRGLNSYDVVDPARFKLRDAARPIHRGSR